MRTARALLLCPSVALIIAATVVIIAAMTVDWDEEDLWPA